MTERKKNRSANERMGGGFPGESYTRPCPVAVHPLAKPARVWMIEANKPTMGIARIADRQGPQFGYGAEVRIQIAGATEAEIEHALGWFLKTFPSAETRPTDQEDERPYVLNPITLGEALGQA